MQRSQFCVALVSIILAGAAPLAAAPCQSLPSPVYVSGSPVLLPLVGAMSSALAASPTPITVVFQTTDSCTAVSAFTTLQSPLLTGTGQIWTAGGEQSSCDLGSGAATDVGISDLFPASCGASDLADNVSEQFGPVAALSFVAPRTSQASSISRNAAYMVFGFGAQAAPLIAPWNNPSSIFHFAPSASTQLMLGIGIGVPAAKWQPTANALGSAAAMVTAMSAPSGSASATIGILASDLADSQRARLKVLAYQETGQSCAYYPNSSSTAVDRQNVRDGHYPLWGRSHFFYRSSDSGTPLSASVAIVLGLISGSTSAGSVNAVQLEASSGLVPDCAMRVTRSAEMAPLESYMPSVSCSCYFEALTGGAPATCTPCTANGQCAGATPICNFGYCDIQ